MQKESYQVKLGQNYQIIGPCYEPGEDNVGGMVINNKKIGMSTITTMETETEENRKVETEENRKVEMKKSNIKTTRHKKKIFMKKTKIMNRINKRDNK